MDKGILELVSNFALWHGDTYKLAALVADMQKQIDREVLIAADMVDAAGLIV